MHYYFRYNYETTQEGRENVKKTDFEKIYSQYHKNLYIYALSLCGDPNLSEILVQNTFTKAYLSYKPGGSLKFWLSKVLKNEFLNHIRHEAKFVDDPQLVFDKLHSDDNPINILIEEENMREIAIAISLLPINQRSVIMYRIYMQLTDKEISQIIGTSEVNIRKIRSRARQNLKKILEERNIGDRYDRQKRK
nr:sigma-70 family RNA polymerase sigma factor [Peptostreptococcus anaerobius]